MCRILAESDQSDKWTGEQTAPVVPAPIWRTEGKATLPLGCSALRIERVGGGPAIDIAFHERRSHGTTQFGYLYPPSDMTWEEVLRWGPREMLAVLEDLLPHLRAYVAAQEVPHA